MCVCERERGGERVIINECNKHRRYTYMINKFTITHYITFLDFLLPLGMIIAGEVETFSLSVSDILKMKN